MVLTQELRFQWLKNYSPSWKRCLWMIMKCQYSLINHLLVLSLKKGSTQHPPPPPGGTPQSFIIKSNSD